MVTKTTMSSVKTLSLFISELSILRRRKHILIEQLIYIYICPYSSFIEAKLNGGHGPVTSNKKPIDLYSSS